MKRALFNLSNEHKLTCDMAEIIPVNAIPVNPGDTFQGSTALLLRMTPLLAPLMHSVIIRVHHFFVPNRLIWEDWQDFITGGADGLDSSVHPYIALGSATEGTLHDYMGFPVDTYGGTINVDALPFRAYNLIFNEYYRDEQLVTARTIDLTDGEDTTSTVTLASCAWEKDYFTTLRPDTKLGSDVTIPLGDEAPVLGIGAANTTYPLSNQTAYEADEGTAVYAGAKEVDSASADSKFYVEKVTGTNYPYIRADLSSATGIDIADLRLALAVQRFQERHNVYGTRYSEYLRYLGIRNDIDARLQRPEFLGGGKSIVQFSEVLSTDSGGTDPVGDMKGHGIAAMKTNTYRRFFPEHGWQMSLLSVIPRSSYMNGIPRKFLRTAKEDYFQREFASIGDQTVTNKEIYAAHGTPDGTFGYGPRYDEYRSELSRVSGEFNSTLNHWHLSRDFGSNPALNSTFITANPTKRHLASSSTDGLIISAINKVAARRLIPKRAISKTF